MTTTPDDLFCGTTLPNVFTALRRIVTLDECEKIAAVYRSVDSYGGNNEYEVVREEGVSYNQLLARVISIQLSDVGVRDVSVFVTTLWSALVYDAHVLCGGRPVKDVPEEMVVQIEQIINDPLAQPRYAVIRASLDLDRTRHLHISTLSLEARLRVIESTETLYGEALLAVLPKPLCAKLHHACMLQRRRLKLDCSE